VLSVPEVIEEDTYGVLVKGAGVCWYLGRLRVIMKDLITRINVGSDMFSALIIYPFDCPRDSSIQVC
jgi:hypothetical protein